jgi:phosphatidylserine decarboxylase precursor-related protein
MVKEGYYFGLPLLALGLAAFLAHWMIAGILLLCLAAFVFYFVPGKRISIFLAIWNVHVNRSPAAGTIVKMDYRPGKFFAAMRARASLENEQNVISLSTASGEMVFKQIAGLIARRVVCWKKVGDVVQRGERIGLVRFGSRVDMWVPRDADILVAVGDNVQGGSSVLARWPAAVRPGRDRGMDAKAPVENLTAAGKQT